jgi:uncharacterized membrane protein YtjA (UPF0391 family)
LAIRACIIVSSEDAVDYLPALARHNRFVRFRSPDRASESRSVGNNANSRQSIDSARVMHHPNSAGYATLFWSLAMLQLAIACLVIALIAALLGLAGLAGSMAGVAKVIFFVFLIFAVLSFLRGAFRRRRFWI